MQEIIKRPSRIGTARKRKAAEKKTCPVCGMAVAARGFKSHVRLAHQLEITQVVETIKMQGVTQVKAGGGIVDLSKHVNRDKIKPVDVYETKDNKTGEVCVTWSFFSKQDRDQFIQQENSWMYAIKNFLAFSEEDGLYNMTHCRIPANHSQKANRIPTWALDHFLRYR